MQSPPLLFRFDWEAVDLDSVLANSYKDFHCKGLDYICLQRKPFLTIKAYFFEDAIVDLPEWVEQLGSLDFIELYMSSNDAIWFPLHSGGCGVSSDIAPTTTPEVGAYGPPGEGQAMPIRGDRSAPLD